MESFDLEYENDLSEEEIKIVSEIEKGHEPVLIIDKEYSAKFYNECISFYQKKNLKPKGIYPIIKRLLDVILSAIGIVLLIIPSVFILAIIAIDGGKPLIIKNIRVGKNKRFFNCLKFRTLRSDAPSNNIGSEEFTEKYITKSGRFLRKTSIDELPQLINIFRGDMSFVGYRPLVPAEEKCNAMREQMGVFDAKPGLTGYAQVNGRKEVYYKNKAIMDAYYLQNLCFAADIKIFFKTFSECFVGLMFN